MARAANDQQDAPQAKQPQELTAIAGEDGSIRCGQVHLPEQKKTGGGEVEGDGHPTDGVLNPRTE